MTKINYVEILNSSKEHVTGIINALNQYLEYLKTAQIYDKDEKISLLLSEVEKAKGLFQKIPLEVKEFKGKAAQVVALCGPGKAGKSTVFNMMSGFNTCKGYDKSTMSSLAIFPDENLDEASTEGLINNAKGIFPNFDIKELDCIEDVLKEGEPADRLFVSNYKSDNHNINTILLDLPDFDSIKETNWEKAKQGISRADTIIFTVSVEKYRTMPVYNLMREVLTQAGSFVYLLTKIDPSVEDPKEEDYLAAAKRIRENLIEEVNKKEEFTKSFNADGKSFAYLIENCPFYYSRVKSIPCLDDIKPLANCVSDFKQMAFNGSVATIYESKIQKLLNAIAKSNDTSDCLQVYLANKINFNSDIESIVKKSARKFIGNASDWPVPYILSILREELNKTRSSISLNLERAFTKVVSFLPLLAKTAKDKIKEQFFNSSLKFSGDDLNNRLIENADDCLKEISLSKYAPADKKLDHVLRNELIEKFQNAKPPYLGEWREEVRKDIEAWIKEQQAELIKNKAKAIEPKKEVTATGFKYALLQLCQLPLYVLKPFKEIINWLYSMNKYEWIRIINSCSDIFLPLGILLIILDYYVDGGIGHLGLITIIGACPALTSAISAYLAQVIGAIGLSDIAKKAQESWKEKTIKAYSDFLCENLVDPNFVFEHTQKDILKRSIDIVSECRKSNNELKTLLTKSENVE